MTLLAPHGRRINCLRLSVTDRCNMRCTCCIPAVEVQKLLVGETLLEVTQIGKECHTRCAIYDQAGDCVMPNEGIFARVLRGGTVKPGSGIEVSS